MNDYTSFFIFLGQLLYCCLKLLSQNNPKTNISKKIRENSLEFSL